MRFRSLSLLAALVAYVPSPCHAALMLATLEQLDDSADVGRRHAAPMVVVGVMAAPGGHATRAAARQTWIGGQMPDVSSASRRVVVRFVIGRRHAACNTTQLQHELARHSDFALVDAPDCRKWHSPEKVHRWFQYALARWPRTPWLGKMEDDGMLWPAALAADLSGLVRNSTYYGVMRWAGTCSNSRLSHGGCYAGSFPIERPSCTIRDDQRCNVARSCCEPLCPGEMRYAPFACGPLDVRHRSLARRIAECAAADALFREMSTLGDEQGRMRGTTDGSQATAFWSCLEGLHVADATDSRFAMGPCSKCS